jgi:hypothetical protein
VIVRSSSETEKRPQCTFPTTALRYALQPSTQSVSCLDARTAACVAIDRAAQGETKRRARAWVPGRKAGRRDVRS